MSVIWCQGWKQGSGASEGWPGYGVSVLTIGCNGTKVRGHPQVRWACVKDNLEILRGCSNSIYREKEGVWVSAELSTLESHTGVSLWVLYISWDHFPTTVKLTELITEALVFDIFFICYIVCRILILWPGVEVVLLALEAQRHNHWTSRTIGHPEKSWCLHLRNSVVSSNRALALFSPRGPSRSTPATPFKFWPHRINNKQVTLSCDMFSLFASLSGWHGHSWRQNKPFV